MAAPARRVLVPFLLAASLSFAHLALAQVPGRDIGTARDLYASARYDEALAVLNDIRPADSAPVSDRKSIEQYRSLCLLALGRGTEAESAIAAVVTADPSYQPGEAEASPRVRSAFSEVRKRLLPDIASQRYAEAKANFDRKQYTAAVPQFRTVISLIDDPDMGGRQADLRTLASGFLDLAVAASAPPPDPPKPAPAPAVPPAPQPNPNRIYSMVDKDVTPPVIIRQEMPRLTPAMTVHANDRGIVEVVIDEQGRVSGVTIRQSVHPLYDQELMAAARDWRYQPASIAGRAVKYRKSIQINVNR
ncbi:MAG TPA: TonB family protein [Vicinamibacterales bacterium]|jgi:TonB family protein|nr:TonB family protein [Vicinamibacterales bacterium]